MSPALLLLLTGCLAGPRFPGPLHPLAERPLRARSGGSTASIEPSPATGAPPAATPTRASRRDDPLGTAMADAARYYLLHDPAGYRADCSGFVSAVSARAGQAIEGSTQSMWETAESLGLTHHKKTPRPGDLAFFDGTYDRDRDGRQDDVLTHVAVVLSVDDDGTITLAHGGTSVGRTELRMNLQHPDRAQDDAGKVLNDPLRQARRSDPSGTKYLAGQLWHGFASLRLDALADEESTSD